MATVSSISFSEEAVVACQGEENACIVAGSKAPKADLLSADKDHYPSFASFSMDLKKISIRELLNHCLQTNDSTGWTIFVRRVEPTISGVVARSLRRWTRPHPDLIEDRVQETHLKLAANDYAALRKFEWTDEDAIFRFLKVVASRIVEDYRRSKLGHALAREDGLPEGAEFATTRTDGPDREIEKGQRWRQIECTLRSVLGAEPNFSRDWQIFQLYHRFGYSARVIAEFPSIQLQAKPVENILLRMFRILKSHLGPGDGARGAHSS